MVYLPYESLSPSLSLSPGAVAARAGEFGQGFGRVHLDNLNCTGSETNIYDCPSSVLEQVNCFGFESDVGVICPCMCIIPVYGVCM